VQIFEAPRKGISVVFTLDFWASHVVTSRLDSDSQTSPIANALFFHLYLEYRLVFIFLSVDLFLTYVINLSL
jgi:hypothetical protein